MNTCNCDDCRRYRASLERARTEHAATVAAYAATINKLARRVRWEAGR